MLLGGGANDAKAAFHDAMRKLWEDHIVWTRQFIVSAATESGNLADIGPTTDRLLANQADIGNALKPFYGDAAGEQVTALLRDHILTAAELVAAAKAGDQAAVEAASAAWYRNADDIATAPHTAADLVESLAIGIEMLTGPYRIVTAARLTLFMEANHNPEIRAAVSQTRRVMERSIVAVMARLGATDPYSAALALMACGEGIILHRIARHDTSDPRPLLRVVVNAALPD